MLKKDGFEKLGYYSNAINFFVQGIAAFISLPFIDKFGDRKVMAWGGAITIPYTISLFLPACKSEDSDSTSWYFGFTFVTTIILLASAFNGFG